MISMVKPLIGDEEKKAVMEVMDSGVIAQGPKVKEFEDRFAEYVGTKYAIATTSGTTALHIALLAAGIKPGDEVITTPFTFIASSNSVLFCGAKPVFADVGEDYNIDPGLIAEKITKKTKALLPVHLYGQPADMKPIMELAEDRDLVVVEDACQAHGAEYDGKRVGSFSNGCFSFYPTKNMTSGEGGMITTDDKGVYEQCLLLRAHGMKVRYHHDILGYNFRLTDIGAAIGLEQLKKLEGFNRVRIRNARLLSKGLSKIGGIITPKEYDNRRHVFHQYTIRLSDFPLTRDEVMKALSDNEIGSMIYYPIPSHKQKLYVELGYKDKLPVCEKYCEEVLSLPVHPAVTEEDVRQITTTFKNMV
ncbi:MAG: DegT/DnrJ/EryC1/StrS family aminotransferase [Candidatus Altiarchaeota archaeon]